MRFSLATLLLLVLWLASAMWVWAWREPWVFARVVRNNVPQDEWMAWSDSPRNWAAPDGRRHLHFDGNTWISGVWPVYVVAYWDGEPQVPREFLDNDTVRLYRVMGRSSLPIVDEVEYRRRFPEWWWGHGCRPEVWVFTLLGGALLWRGVKARRQSAA